MTNAHDYHGNFSVFLSSYRNMIFNQSGRVNSLGYFLNRHAVTLNCAFKYNYHAVIKSFHLECQLLLDMLDGPLILRLLG